MEIHIFILKLENGIRFVKNINQQGEFEELNYLEQVTHKQIFILQYYQLKLAVKGYIQKHNINFFVITW